MNDIYLPVTYYRKIAVFIISFFFIISFGFSQNLNKGSIDKNKYYEEITFEYVKEKIIIPVKIEGKTYRFIFDTGAPNIISEEIYNRIQPKLIQTVVAKDATANRESLNVVSVNSLYLGKTLFKNTATLVYDLNANQVFECFKIDGFIGSNMLRNSIIQIDLDLKILRITNSKKNLGLDKNNATKIKLVGIQSSPYVWIELENDKTGRNQVMIDTGSSSIYDLSKETYRRLQEIDLFIPYGKSSGASTVSLFGDAPLNEHYRVGIPKLRINNFEITNHVTNTTNDNNSSIGLGILEYGIMTIDFKNKRFYFNPKVPSINDEKVDFGFSQTLLDNKLVVGFVWDNDLKSKMSYGDQILQINNITLSDSNFCELLIEGSPFKNETSVAMKIKSKDGTIKTINVSKTLAKTQNYSQN